MTNQIFSQHDNNTEKCWFFCLVVYSRSFQFLLINFEHRMKTREINFPLEMNQSMYLLRLEISGSIAFERTIIQVNAVPSRESSPFPVSSCFCGRRFREPRPSLVSPNPFYPIVAFLSPEWDSQAMSFPFFPCPFFSRSPITKRFVPEGQLETGNIVPRDY